MTEKTSGQAAVHAAAMTGASAAAITLTPASPAATAPSQPLMIGMPQT
jgi:hypothetical protein